MRKTPLIDEMSTEALKKECMEGRAELVEMVKNDNRIPPRILLAVVDGDWDEVARLKALQAEGYEIDPRCLQ